MTNALALRFVLAFVMGTVSALAIQPLWLALLFALAVSQIVSIIADLEHRRGWSEHADAVDVALAPILARMEER